MKEIALSIQFEDETEETGEVQIDGKVLGNPVKFILDTGCAKTSIPYNDFTAALKRISSRASSGAISRANYETVLVDTLEFGPILKKNLEISRAENGGLNRNLLGMDILKDYCLHVKFSEKKVEMLEREISLKYAPILMDKGSIPYVDVRCVNTIAKAVWDTGAGITLVDSNFLNKNPTMFKPAGMTSGMDSTGATVESPLYLMMEVQIGQYSFAPHKVVAIDLAHVHSKIEFPMDFILGYSTIRQAHWVFDFPKERWAISKMINL